MTLTPGELYVEAATNYRLYCSTFFPQTFRDPWPVFADQMWDCLESSNARYVNFLLYRGSSKTTNLRANMSKRIAYGVSRVMLYVAASSAKAEMSLMWIKRQVEKNKTWTEFYGLEPGSKWTDVLIEIVNTRLGMSTWVIAFGLTGKHRGINIDDFRPDMIGIDDIIDEEVAASEDQRRKANALVHGSLIHSLTPRRENPQSKVVMLQTPFNSEDPSVKATKDPMWTSMIQGCWTKETENLPLEFRRSVWEEREPTEDLKLEYLGALARNEISLFAREKECKLVTPEQAAFKPEWLVRYGDVSDIPGGLIGGEIGIGIDPVPPPTDLQVKQGMLKKDFECISVMMYKQLDFWLLDYVFNRGHDPDWTIARLFEFIVKYRPRWIRIEATAYQKTLSWLIAKEMAKRGHFTMIVDVKDKRPKATRIVQAIKGPAYHRRLHVKYDHSDFITQYNDYPNVVHEDILDSVSMCIDGFVNDEIADETSGLEDEPLEYLGGAP